MVSEEHSDKNTTPPLVTAQTTAVDVTWDSDMDAVVNNEGHESKQRMTLKDKAIAVLFRSLSPVYTDINGEGWSWVPGGLKESCLGRFTGALL